MDSYVALTGSVVRLEPLDRSHAAGLLAAADEDRSTYGLTKVPADETAMASYLELACAEREAGISVPFVTTLAETGRIVGSTRFLDIEFWPLPTDPGPRETPSTTEIGATWLAASAQRTAVNTEAKLLMLTHAFEVWGVCRVSLQTDARNARSRAAIERIGAQFEGVRRGHKLGADSTIRDSAFYSITADEWPVVQATLTSRLSHESLPRASG